MACLLNVLSQSFLGTLCSLLNNLYLRKNLFHGCLDFSLPSFAYVRRFVVLVVAGSDGSVDPSAEFFERAHPPVVGLAVGYLALFIVSLEPVDSHHFMLWYTASG